MNGHINFKDEATIKELMTIKYTYDHQQRKILISKLLMRSKYKIKSPNKADAVIMAVSLVDDVKIKQDTQYRPQHTTSKEENLFGLAGVR